MTTLTTVTKRKGQYIVSYDESVRLLDLLKFFREHGYICDEKKSKIGEYPCLSTNGQQVKVIIQDDNSYVRIKSVSRRGEKESHGLVEKLNDFLGDL